MAGVISVTMLFVTSLNIYWNLCGKFYKWRIITYRLGSICYLTHPFPFLTTSSLPPLPICPYVCLSVFGTFCLSVDIFPCVVLHLCAVSNSISSDAVAWSIFGRSLNGTGGRKNAWPKTVPGHWQVFFADEKAEINVSFFVIKSCYCNIITARPVPTVQII